MSNGEFNLDQLPAQTRKSLRELAAKMGCSEEQIVKQMLSATLDEIDNPEQAHLKAFVQKAKKALGENPDSSS